MIDIALRYDPAQGCFDMVLASGPSSPSGQTGLVAKDLKGDDGLMTAVIISLFTDAPAGPSDPLPGVFPGSYNQPPVSGGWWGDFIDPENAEPIGSKLWLLNREKDQNVVVARAGQYAEESLKWLTDEGLIGALAVQASRVRAGYLGLAVSVKLPGGTDERTREWNFVYDYANAVPVGMETSYI